MPDWIWFFVVVVGIPVFAGMGSDMFRRWAKLKEAQLKAMAEANAERSALSAAQTERLEQRVRVLERIVTDKGIVVAEEIERLRDRPLN
ncbi:MAG TPA: hypothetical protein VN231_13805 [Allosphingosinicella sp.]|nr:hypothetical protein [Allosphingosinicella sp.]